MLLRSCSFVIVTAATIISIFVWFIIIIYSVLTIKLFLSQPLSFCFLLILIFLPIPLVRAAGNEWLHGIESRTGVKKSDNKDRGVSLTSYMQDTMSTHREDIHKNFERCQENPTKRL